MPTLAFMIKFNHFMVRVQKYKNIKEANKSLQQDISQKIQELSESKKREYAEKNQNIKTLRAKIEEKKRLI